jgi:hypothetical protein
MPAMNGSSVSFRSHGRLIGCCMALVLLVSALMASTASAKVTLNPTNYVAIGDSLAFGYTQEKFEESVAKGEPGNPSLFEGGYVNAFDKQLAAAEKKEGNAVSIVNLGCPGEISDGMVGHNPAIGGYTYTEKEGETEKEKARNELKGKEHNPCAWHNESGLPYHFNYGSASQLEAAIGLVTGPTPVKMITINMGANDELKVVGMCANKKYDEENGFTGGLFECITVEAGPSGHFYSGGLFHHIIANIGDVIGVVRAYGYKGPVKILGYYNPQSFILPGSDSLQKKLNEVFECAAQAKTDTCHVEPKAGEKLTIAGEEKLGPGVIYGNPFPIFNPQNAKAEKAKIEKLTEECNPKVQKFQTGADPGCEGDIHPTPEGYKKLGNILYKAL